MTSERRCLRSIVELVDFYSRCTNRFGVRKDGYRYNTPTPVVPYSYDLWIKQDYCCFEPEPQVSKMRGLDQYLNRVQGHVLLKVLQPLDKRAVGLARLWNRGPVIFLVPRWKSWHRLTVEYLMRLMLMGGVLIPAPCYRYRVLQSQCKKLLANHDDVFVFPINLPLAETRQSLCDEVTNTPWPIRPRTVIIPTATGNIAAGILRGIHRLGWDCTVIAHLCGKHRTDLLKNRIAKLSEVPVDNLTIVDEGYRLYEPVEDEKPPWKECSPVYDLKSWRWLKSNWRNLQKPVLFWAIG